MFLYGPASRNRTHIRKVEAYCIIHYTIASKSLLYFIYTTMSNTFGAQAKNRTLITNVPSWCTTIVLQEHWCRQQDSNLHTQAYLACALGRYKLPSLPLSYGGMFGTPTPIRTERTAPFERADFTNLSIGAL